MFVSTCISKSVVTYARARHPTTQSVDVLRIHEIVDGAEAGLLHSNEYSEIEGDIVSALYTSRLQNRSSIVIPKNPCKVKMLIISAFLLSLLSQPPVFTLHSCCCNPAMLKTVSEIAGLLSRN